MSFAREKEMTPIVEDWMREQGLFVRKEVWLPSGICDLVGVSVNEDKLAQRIATGFRCARSTAQAWRDIERAAPWLPLHNRILFVELKLNRRGEVWKQAKAHSHMGESYVAMPYPACDYRPINEELYAGVGVLRVDCDGVKVLREAMPSDRLHGQACRVVDSMAMEYGRKLEASA